MLSVRLVSFVWDRNIPYLSGVIQPLLFGQLALFLLFNTTFFWNAILDIYSDVLDGVLRVQIPWKRIASKHEGFCGVWAGLDVGVVQVQACIVDYGVAVWTRLCHRCGGCGACQTRLWRWALTAH